MASVVVCVELSGTLSNFLCAGIYVTNPQDIISEGLVQQQLCSDSVLLVRRQDIVSRWVHNGPADLSVLIQQNDPRWRTMNVLGE